MKQEILARILVITLTLAAVAIPVATRLGGDRLEVRARSAENGGWSPDVIRADVGQPLHLRFTSDDVVHGFGVGQTDIQSVDIEPGKWTDMTLTFDRPGIYTFFCTRWCGLNHWRMRGTIEVGDAPDKSQPATVPLYLSLGLDIDAPHPAPVLPANRPSAISGQQFADGLEISRFASSEYYQAHSPYQLYEDLQRANLTEAQRWDATAYFWQSNTTPEGLAEGRQLYASNCAACHGENGAGDGVFADGLAAQGITGHGDEHGFKQPADFTDPESMLGASPALLQGKILRGGMGTGMPMWGVIFTEEQIWNMVAYLYTFQLEYQP